MYIYIYTVNNPGMRSCGIPRVHKKSRNLFIPLRHKSRN